MLSHRGSWDAIYIVTAQEKRELVGDRSCIVFLVLRIAFVQTTALSLLVSQASPEGGAELNPEPVKQDAANPATCGYIFP